MEDLSIVIAGMGAAGLAIGKILINAGAGEIVGADSRGAIYPGRENLNYAKEWFAREHEPRPQERHDLGDPARRRRLSRRQRTGPALRPTICAAWPRTRSSSPWPTPIPKSVPKPLTGLVSIMATGRSDYPNQINNVLAFPGIFRGALDAGATDITENMKLAAADGIAASVSGRASSVPELIVPSVFDTSVVERVAPAVAEAALRDGVSRNAPTE